MPKKPIIGATISVTEDLDKCFDYVDRIQVNITSSHTFNLPTVNSPFIKKFLPYKDRAPLIVHSPYTISFVHTPNDTKSVVGKNYAASLARISNDLGLRIIYVTHLGTIPQGMSSKTALSNIKANLRLLSPRVRDSPLFKMCFENDSGVVGRSKANTASGLLWMHLNRIGAYPWKSICLDTQHAYASGLSSDRWSSLANVAKVIHLNSIPQHIIKGSCKDEHSKFMLKDSKEKKSIIEVIKIATEKGIPMILERYGWDIIMEDVAFIKSVK